MFKGQWLWGRPRKNWARVLTTIYENEDNWQYFAEGNVQLTLSHPLCEKSGVDKSELKAAINFLKEHGLIKEQPSGEWMLTTEGFEVARTHEIQQTQISHSRAMWVWTAFLTIVSALSIFLRLYDSVTIHLHLW